MLYHPCDFDPRVKPERGTYELDRDHPLARDLLIYTPMAEGAGAVTEDVAAGALCALAGAPGWAAGADAVAFGTGKYAQLRTLNAGDRARYTHFAWFRPDVTADGTEDRIFQQQSGGSTVTMTWGHASASFRQAAVQQDSVGFKSAVIPGTLAAGRWHFLAGAYDGTNLTVWLNGRQQAATAAGAPLSSTGGATFGWNGGTIYLRGSIRVGGYYRRPLSAAEHSWLATEPYAMLRPVVRRAYSIPAGAGPITGVAAVTLGALTAVATGVAPIAGTLAQTLGALTASAAASAPVRGTAAVTLGALTATASGTSAVVGALSQTLGALSAVASAVAPVAAQAAVTLGVLVAVAAGASLVRGAASVLLGALTASATGTVTGGDTATHRLRIRVGSAHRLSIRVGP